MRCLSSIMAKWEDREEEGGGGFTPAADLAGGGGLDGGGAWLAAAMGVGTGESDCFRKRLGECVRSVKAFFGDFGGLITY